MWTFYFFLIITLAQAVLIYFKIDQMKEMGTIGNAIGKAVGVEEKYRPLLDKVALFLFKLRWLLWIVVPVILIVNWIAAWILSIIAHILMGWFGH